MGRQSTFKRVRSAANKQKNKIVLQYMRENSDVVLNSSITVIKSLDFWTRFRFAMDILFSRRKKAMKAYREATADAEKETPETKSAAAGKV
ncbi:hypothetical protein FACS189447_03160 [Spirochaetia bacterium]|nr:hypothetical protein FACS189447_03160 [Spirochaetia bacterium]